MKSKIKSGSWDDIFFIKTNISIEDIKSISYLKTRVLLEPVPASITTDINRAGQTFSGDIDENIVNGIFEVEHKTYFGENAPPFSMNIVHNDSVSQYLKPEETIESDDPALIKKAREITQGSKDLWEASCRLGDWVADNINGGAFDGTALETYKIKSGSCGPQSKLMAALCRAAGVPTRVVWGCLYTPEYEGSFGHHAWNEVYMGEAGWIPVDVTIHETDYIDSGHIRLGVLKTGITVINFKEMEILDYRLKKN